MITNCEQLDNLEEKDYDSISIINIRTKIITNKKISILAKLNKLKYVFVHALKVEHNDIDYYTDVYKIGQYNICTLILFIGVFQRSRGGYGVLTSNKYLILSSLKYCNCEKSECTKCYNKLHLNNSNDYEKLIINFIEHDTHFDFLNNLPQNLKELELGIGTYTNLKLNLPVSLEKLVICFCNKFSSVEINEMIKNLKIPFGCELQIINIFE